MEEFDLIVIGSGSGLDVASGIAHRGGDVAIVEPGRVGGTCLNRGCIPSKMLIHRSDIIQTIKNTGKFHIDAEIENIDFEKMVEEVNQKVHGDSENIEKGLRSSDQLTLFKEEARFVEDKVLELNETEKRIKADKIVVAAGSRPLIPPIEGIEEVDYWTSKEALNPDRKPESVIMIGGGYISLELAHFYDAIGTEVTILERTDRLLNREDRDISETITEEADKRYNVFLETSATRVQEEDDGRKTVSAETDSGGEKVFDAEEVLVAAGRRSNTDKLDLEYTGIETTDKGFIKTDEKMRTTAEGVYALGDIADNWMFKHSANYEAEIVFKNIVSGDDYKIDYPAMPHAVFTSPQIAGVGKTEQELEESEVDYVSASYNYRKTGMGEALKEDNSFVKVLASKEEGKILGCHIIGSEASTLIHEVLVALKSGEGTVNDIKDTIHIHPALNEVVQRAFNQI